MKIPIINIYYLLSYAWDKLEESKKIAVSASDYTTGLELFTRVLLNGCDYLFQRGLDRAYVDRTELYPGIKGKVEFSASITSRSFQFGRAICTFDELEHDVLHNQLIKSTLNLLARVEKLDTNMRQSVVRYEQRFQRVSIINLHRSYFSLVKINKNNSIYGFLLKICQLIVDSISIDQATGKLYFKSFLDQGRTMPGLFEAFIRNFYRKETKGEYKVTSEEIRWIMISDSNLGLSLLPRMLTDVTLRSKNRKIVIDAKFYSKTLSENWGAEKFHSTNLYQIYSYLKNLEGSQVDPLNAECEGILLYPKVDNEIDESFTFGGHRLRIATIDLNGDWRNIHSRLLDLVSDPMSSRPGLNR